MFNRAEKVQLAKAYVALSNSHNLRQVFYMFSPEATYTSTQVGSFQGLEEIKQMMTNFFTVFPNVHWDSRNFQCQEDDTVEFKFVMTGTNSQTNEKTLRHGIETIRFDDDGLISLITVNTDNSDKNNL